MKFYTTHKGFTLVEIIVSISIFLIVAVVALGALLKIIDANKKSQGLKTAMSNINFALESMSRELRVGTHYYCISDGQNYGDPLIVFSLTSLDSANPPQGCDTTSGIWGIVFNSSKTATRANSTVCNLMYGYFFNGFSFYKAEQQTCDQTLSFFPIIYGALNKNDANADESTINFGQSSIRVITGGTAPVPQPYVQVHFTGSSGAKIKNRTVFDIQTTISQRIAD
jgi:prepilin-type N-terminal cleavage/methylation domain-containing protein